MTRLHRGPTRTRTFLPHARLFRYRAAPREGGPRNMLDNRRLGVVAMLGLTLGACAGPAIPRATPPRATTPPPPTVARQVQHNVLIGNSADAIGRMFGKPRLDVTEGAGRNLQFAGRSAERRVGNECVSTCKSRWSPD